MNCLELAVEQGADSKNVYSLLANAFISMSKADRLAELIEKAKQLNSLSRDRIVSMLESLQADTAPAGNLICVIAYCIITYCIETYSEPSSHLLMYLLRYSSYSLEA